MLGDVIEAAAWLAEEAELSVEAALLRYQQLAYPLDRAAQLWVSVAFLLVRNDQLAATYLCGSAVAGQAYSEDRQMIG